MPKIRTLSGATKFPKRRKPAQFRLELTTSVESPAWHGWRMKLHEIARVAAREVLRLTPWMEQKCDLALAVVMLDDAQMTEYNHQFRQKNKPTNVLAFPTDCPEKMRQCEFGDDPVVLGDVLLSGDTIAREAREQGKLFEEHLAHMIVHGCLHLVGHDHMTARQAKEMEAHEVAILGLMNIPNPYERNGTA